MKYSTLRQNGLLSLGNVGRVLDSNRPPQCRARKYRQATNTTMLERLMIYKRALQKRGFKAR